MNSLNSIRSELVNCCASLMENMGDISEEREVFFKLGMIVQSLTKIIEETKEDR